MVPKQSVWLGRSASKMGEYRGIMNLCRVLPNGPDAKLAVDNAIDLASAVGNLRNDILRYLPGLFMCDQNLKGVQQAWTRAGDLQACSRNAVRMCCRCKEAAEQAPGPPKSSPFEQASWQASSAAAARRLGLHYLQRYFYLITFFCYLDSGLASMTSFARWMAERRELKHLLSTLSLEPVM